jgi:hypothetical protein
MKMEQSRPESSNSRLSHLNSIIELMKSRRLCVVGAPEGRARQPNPGLRTKTERVTL